MVEGGSVQNRTVMVNTTGSRVVAETTFGTGISSATSFRSPPNAKFLTIVMPSTNTNPWRMSATTAEVGLAMSSQGATVLTLPESSNGTEIFGYTSSTRAISGVRLVFG